MYDVREEHPDEWWEVEALYDLCFAPGRTALSSYRLRDGVAPVKALSLVARDADGALAAVIRYWPIEVSGRQVLLLGPIAVHPIHQGEGLGALLMRASLKRAKSQGWSRVMLVGDYPYYKRFGFEPLRGVEMPPPTNPDRILKYDLQSGAWDGIRGQVMKWTRGTSEP